MAALTVWVACLATASLTPLLDPDEGYYAATASETLASGSFWDLRLDDQPRWEKPPLSYVLIEAGFLITGANPQAARLPSAFEGALLVLISGVLVARLAGRRAAWFCAGVMATSLGIQAFSRAAHPEIAVVLSIVSSELLVCLWFADGPQALGRRLPVYLGVAVAYGLLAKGPIALLLPGLMAAAAAPFVRLARDRWTAALSDGALALGVAFALTTPWYAAMTVRHGSVFLREALWNQNVARYEGAMYVHPHSVLFFVIPAAVVMLPWTAFIPAAVISAFRPADSRRQILRISAVAGLITAFAFYSLSKSSLASYALVFAPPLAILVGLYLDEQPSAASSRSGPELWSAVLLGTVGIALLWVPFLVFGPIDPRGLLGGVPAADSGLREMLWRPVVSTAALFLGGAVTVLTASRRVRIGTLLAVGAVVPVALIVGARPALRSVYPWASFGGHIREAGGQVWIVGYRAPSLTFYAGRAVERLTDMGSLEDRLEQPTASGWVVVDAHQLTELFRDPAIDPARLEVVETGARMRLLRVSPQHHAWTSHQ